MSICMSILGVYVSIMLDATKAFDRVQYCKLFRKLIDRNLPLVIIRFFIKYVYDASDTC